MPIFKRKRRKLPLRVEDIMSSPPITVSNEATIEEVANIMCKEDIGSVMVVDKEGKLVGIVTERDLIHAITKKDIGKGIPVWMIMTENPVSVQPGTHIVEAIKKMRNINVRHLPVVDKDGKPLGMISMRDLIDAAMVFLQLLIE